MTGRGAAALLGIAVTGVTIALAEVLAALAGTGPGPVEAVAEAFIDLTPGWLKDLAIAWFGTSDKVALGAGIAVVVTALAAVAGTEERRRRLSGGALVAVLGAVAALATVSRPDGGAPAVWPVLAATVVGVLALPALTPRDTGLTPRDAALTSRDAVLTREGALTRDGTTPDVSTPGSAVGPTAGQPVTRPDPARRTLLIGAGLLAGVAVAAAAVARSTARPAPPAVALPEPDVPAPPVPAGAELAVAGLTPLVTPNDDFYRIDTAFIVPRVDATTWQLRVHGMVEEEVVLTYEDLLAESLTEAWVTLCCVSNDVGGPLIGNAAWVGVPVREVLARARPTAGADMVLSRSVDGFSASTPLEVLTDGRDALLAVAMNGEPLPPEHGYPVRLVVPGLYGYVSATKWVSELEVTRFEDQTAYWTDRGWSERGPVKISSRIDVPRSGASLAVGEIAVAGVAWAQHTGIARVEVRVDGGAWEEAELAGELDVDTWRQWVYRWRAGAGEYLLEVRATDQDGEVQTGETRPVLPDGATGWHGVRVRVD